MSLGKKKASNQTKLENNMEKSKTMKISNILFENLEIFVIAVQIVVH